MRMRAIFLNLLFPLLLVGLVDQVNKNVALIEYEQDGRILHSTVDLDLSACIPEEGQWVAFYKDYKVVTCGVIPYRENRQ